MRSDAEEYEFNGEEGYEAELSERARRQLTEEQQLIDELEADAEEHPIEDDEISTDESAERKLLKRELRAQALKRLEDSARTLRDFEALVTWYDRLMPTVSEKSVITSCSEAATTFPLITARRRMACSFPILSMMCCPSWNARAIS